MLPTLCTNCHLPLRDDTGKLQVLHFGRRTLQSELEYVFRVRGLEEAIKRGRERKEKRDEEDERLKEKEITARGASSPSWTKIWRQQDDGSAWTSRRAQNADAITADVLTITVNLGIDWASPSSRRAAAADSMGPITLYLADVPAELRSAFCCTMIVGITPGPKQPKASNLHKNLLAVTLELRAAGRHGLWVRTPEHPSGRLVRVVLGCIVADRPAAVEVTGGPHYKAKATPCLRCTTPSIDIVSLRIAPARESYAHNVGTIRQVFSYLPHARPTNEIGKPTNGLRLPHRKHEGPNPTRSTEGIKL